VLLLYLELTLLGSCDTKGRGSFYEAEGVAGFMKFLNLRPDAK